MFHNHRWSLSKTDDYMDRLVFHFTCLECGQLKTRLVEKGSNYDITVG
jgi:hypothetical protein